MKKPELYTDRVKILIDGEPVKLTELDILFSDEYLRIHLNKENEDLPMTHIKKDEK